MITVWKKLPGQTNGCEEDSWLNGKEETSRPNDVAQLTYRDALMRSEHMAHSIRFTKKLVLLIACAHYVQVASSALTCGVATT